MKAPKFIREWQAERWYKHELEASLHFTHTYLSSLTDNRNLETPWHINHIKFCIAHEARFRFNLPDTWQPR